MKKFLLCTLLAGLTIPAMAQEQRSVDVGLWTSAGVSQSYDRQTQGSVYPMTQIHDDGFIGCTWTNEDNPYFSGGGTNPYRGVGYSYSTDGGQTWSAQENRVGGIPLYWPSYAQWGANGEAILARSADSYAYNGVQILNGLVLLTRPNKGQGEWNMTIVPYPAGYIPGSDAVMAWARMTTSGPNHQYIHIMSPMRIMPAGNQYLAYYYRTQNGTTWDIEAALVTDMVGQDWGQYTYSDGINFAARGNTVACSFMYLGDHGYVLKSQNNGDTWECIKFFDTPIREDVSPAIYSDTVYIPVQGCIALDNNGKIHVAFSVVMAMNNDPGGFVYFLGLFTSFLSYWNEDMAPIDGATDFVYDEIYPLLENYFDWGQYCDYYVISTVPQWPVVGYFTPTNDDHCYSMVEDAIYWAGTSYGGAGMFSFPQMTFDAENTLHLAYLGLLDEGGDYYDDTWRRHPFYTTTSDGGQTWTQTEYLVNNVDVIDQEFAYLTLAGVSADNKMYLMAQVDPYPGVYTAYVNQQQYDHGPTNNYFYFFTVEGVVPPPPPPPCDAVTDATANIEPDCKSATITWTAVADAKEYEITRDGILLDKVTDPAYTEIFDFVTDTTYVWWIRTICDESESTAVSASATADCEVCDPVTNASATIQDCETATITWETVTDAKEYKITRDGVETVTVTIPPYTENFDFEHGQSYTWTIVSVCEYTESDEISVSASADCVGISELANSVFIYPNPTSGMVTITAKDFAKVEVYNTIGQLIETTTDNVVDVSSCNTGIYFFKVYDVNGNSVTQRVMVAR